MARRVWLLAAILLGGALLRPAWARRKTRRKRKRTKRGKVATMNGFFSLMRRGARAPDRHSSGAAVGHVVAQDGLHARATPTVAASHGAATPLDQVLQGSATVEEVAVVELSLLVCTAELFAPPG